MRNAGLALLVAGLVLAACGDSQRAAPGAAHLGPGLAGVGRLPAPASAWPQAGYDARHSSATPAVGPQHAHMRWRRALEGDATPGPVLGVDGSVLAATNAGVLHALDPRTGRDVWRFDGGGAYGTDMSTSPAVLVDGTVLWPGPGNTLFALTKDGRLRWRSQFGAPVLSPAVAGHDRVYVSDLDGDVRAFEITPTTHRRVWDVRVGGPDYASPTVGPDGTIYAADDHDLVALRDLGERGAIRWRFHTKRLVEVSNAVTADGTVVLGTNHDMEFGVGPDGSVRWAFDVGDYTYSSSIARPDGVGAFGDNMGRLRIIDTRTGRVTVTVTPLGPGMEKIWTSTVIDAHDDVYWGSTAGRVYGYTKGGHQLFAFDAGAGVQSYPALGGDGTLYFGTTDGTVYALDRGAG